jgi:hypothetical protein
MTVNHIKQKNNRYKNYSDYLYIFENSEALNTAIGYLYKQGFTLKSSLYKAEKDYRLIISSRSFKPCLLTLKEYSANFSRNLFEIELTKEHCKPILTKNAVRTYGKYFFKEI